MAVDWNQYRTYKMTETATYYNREILEPLLGYIIDYKRQNDGLSPTVREIMAEMGIPSHSTVVDMLNELCEAGKLEPLYRSGRVALYRVPGGEWVHDVR